MNNRIQKIEALKEVFRTGNKTLLSKQGSMCVMMHQDRNGKRQERAKVGNEIRLWNYSDDEAQAFKTTLEKQYQLVILSKLSYNESRNQIRPVKQVV